MDKNSGVYAIQLVPQSTLVITWWKVIFVRSADFIIFIIFSFYFEDFFGHLTIVMFLHRTTAEQKSTKICLQLD